MAISKKEANSKKALCKMVTPEFRVSYPHLFKPHAPKAGDKPKFSVTMLFPKDVKIVGDFQGERRTLIQILKNAKIAEFGAEENWPKNLETPVVDGDDDKHEDKDGYAGHWVVKATSSADYPPRVVDQNVKNITVPSDIYPGCYARASVYAYIWFYPDRVKTMKMGVGLILDHVQKMRDGKPFGGKIAVENVFSPVTDQGDEDEEGEESFL